MARPAEPVTIKRYGNELLCNPTLGAYVTLDDLVDLIEDDEEFVATEARTGENITRSVLRQIISARGRHG